MRIVSFDLGACFAWATNKPPKWGSVKLEGVRPQRFYQLIEYLQAQSWLKKLDVAVYEEPFVRGKDATRSLWGYAAIVEACITYHKLPVIGINLRTVKKFATGNGNAAKSEMMLAAQKWGYTGSSPDESDAYCLLKYAEASLERVGLARQ